MATRITRMTKGRAPTLLEAAYGNQVIDTCNAFRLMRVFGGEFLFSGDVATLTINPQTIAAQIAFPFNVGGAGAFSVSIEAGQVNGITPTAGGTPLTSAHSLAVAQGTSGIYLVGTIDTTTALTFGDLASVAVVSSVAPLVSTFENPALKIATVTANSEGIQEIRSGVFSNLQLTRWYSDYLWSGAISEASA